MKEFGNKELYLELATDTKEELGGNQIWAQIWPVCDIKSCETVTSQETYKPDK
jgi:hypothetical protein